MAGKKTPGQDPANRDPITHAPGAHPVAVGAGAAGAGAAGAAIGGVVGGPIGAVVGAAVGAVAGGLGGKAAAEAVNPSVEEAYWRDEYRNRPYARAQDTYETWESAYRYGWEARLMHGGSTWEQVEPQLAAGWTSARGNSTLDWDRAKDAAREAFERLAGAKQGPPNKRDQAFDTIRDDVNPRPSASHTGEPISRGEAKDPLDR